MFLQNSSLEWHDICLCSDSDTIRVPSLSEVSVTLEDIRSFSCKKELLNGITEVNDPSSST